MKLLDQVEFTINKRRKSGYICGVIRDNPMQYEARYDFEPMPFRGRVDDFTLVKSYAANDA